MKKLMLFTVLVLGLALAAPSAFSASAVTGHRVIIDAGHGGTDPGSTECPGLYESDANLDIALRLRALLIADGATVYLTRTDDVSLSNNDRYLYANSTDGEVLVSVHLNGSTDHSVNGTVGLWGKKNKDLDFTTVIHNRQVQELGVPNIGVTNFASGVLLKSTMPATIAESVYISNSTECALLTDGTGNRQQAIAQSLYLGLIDWFSQTPPSGGGGSGGNGGGGNGGGNGGGKPNSPGGK